MFCDLVRWVISELAIYVPWLTWENIKIFANSSFTTSLAGAFAGAWGAQLIATRVKLRDELQSELRNTNTGIMLAHSIASIAYSLKKQHVKALKESYDNDCKAFEAFNQKPEAERAKAPLELAINVDRIDVISTPIATIQEIVMGKISTTGRAIASVSALAGAIGNLNDALTGRNELLAKIKEEKLPAGAELHHYYFGLEYAKGKSNLEFGHYVNALSLYTNHVIFFSVKLCDDLREHGLHVAKKHKEKLGGKAPDVSNADWSKGEQEGMIPKDEDFKDWLSGFQSRPQPKRRWWQLWKPDA